MQHWKILQTPDSREEKIITDLLVDFIVKDIRPLAAVSEE